MNSGVANSGFEYDVAISFASDDKPVAEKLASLLVARNLSVFHDEFTASSLWGNDVIDHLVNLCARKARFCVLLISQYYPLKTWTKEERMSIQERAFRDANEYIFPLRLDDSDVPGIAEVAGYMDLRPADRYSLEGGVNILDQKMAKSKAQSGPPPRSHDLRSGNVPTKREP